MKWTDLALVFALVVICGIVALDLDFKAKEAVVYTENMYNRILDETAADAMLDAVLYEAEDGAVLDEEKVLKQLEEEMYFLFAAKTSEDRLRVRACIKCIVLTQQRQYHVYGNEGLDWVLEKEEDFDIDEIRKDLERVLPGNLSIGYIEGEEWYQSVSPLQIYMVFQGLPVEWPQEIEFGQIGTKEYTRIVRAGARLKKEEDPLPIRKYLPEA